MMLHTELLARFDYSEVIHNLVDSFWKTVDNTYGLIDAALLSHVVASRLSKLIGPVGGRYITAL
jgi:hypothetical protein